MNSFLIPYEKLTGSTSWRVIYLRSHLTDEVFGK